MAAYIALVLSESSVNVTNNTSLVTADLYYYGNGVSHNGYPTGSEAPVGQITIDGTTYSAFNKTFTTSTSAQYLGSASKTVTHKSDGSYTVNASATFNTKVSLGTLSCSKSLTLTTIPRKSSISAVSASALGSASTITVTKQSSSFTHTITYKCGSATGTVCTKSSSTSVSWTPPNNLANQNTSGTSLTITFTIETFNGSTSLGTNTWTSYAYTIPNNSTFKPTVSLEVADVYDYRATYGAYVQGKSALQIGVTAAGKNGASIKSYTTTIDGKTYATSSITTSVLSGTDTLTIKTSVTDSRGFTNSTTWDIEVLPYSAPKITSSSVKRTASDGSASANGAYLTVTYDGEYSSLNSKNTITYTVKYKKTTDENYSSPATTTGGKYTFAADTASSYDIVLTATDNLESVNKVLAGPSISKFLSFLGNRGLAIGKVAELLDTLDIGWLTRIRNHLSIGNKSSGTDGKTGTFIHKDGIIYIQRDDSQGYHPYIGFLHGDETSVAGTIRTNCDSRYMEFLSAQGYSFGNKMVMPNNKFFFAKDTDGTERNLFGLNDSNNLLIGWDLYDKSLGNTVIYGDQVRFNAKNGFNFDGGHARLCNATNSIGRFRFNSGWIGMYQNEANANSHSNRLGWIGFDNSSTMLNINNDCATTSSLIVIFTSFQQSDGNYAGLKIGYDYVAPTSNNTEYLGYSTFRWKAVYSSTGTIQTSDRNKKEQIESLTEKYESLFFKLKPVTFKFKNEEGYTHDRIHAGFISQDVEESLAECGLTALDFAGFCKDEKKVEVEEHKYETVYDSDGNPEYEYSLRYEEFIALNTHMIQKQQKEIESLKAEVTELKVLVKKLLKESEEIS